MPFQEATVLPENPSVRIFFTGLLIIQPDAEGKTCEVFVNRSAPDHQLSIEIRLKRNYKPDAILMRHLGPLAFLQLPADLPIHGFFIEAQSPYGVRRYTGDPTQEGESLGLAIDLEDEQLHEGGAGDVDPRGGRPSILLNDAIFYTADKTSDKLTIKLKKGETEVRELEPFASVIGANIYLEGDNSVFVRWRQNGLPKVLQLRKPEEGSSYEIYIINDPLYIAPRSAEKHDEFHEYYKILPEVDSEDQFSLDVKFPEDEDEDEHEDRGSTTTPCMPVVKGG